MEGLGAVRSGNAGQWPKVGQGGVRRFVACPRNGLIVAAYSHRTGFPDR